VSRHRETQEPAVAKKILGVETVADEHTLSIHPKQKTEEILALLAYSRRPAAQPETNEHALSNHPMQETIEELAVDSMALLAHTAPKKFALSIHPHRGPMTLVHPERTLMQA